MKRKLLTTIILSISALSSQADVSLSQTSKGDMVILPYYSVKNNMNTTFSVVNHSQTQGKVILVAFKESKQNYDVLFYNVFLKPNSSWSLGLAAKNSTIGAHVGEPSVIQYHNSDQCAPFLTTQQEFLPYAYEESETTNLSLERAQEGHIEIYEIGSLNPNNSAVNLNDCGSISQSIANNATFINQHLSPSTGDISATASLLNVAEGASYSYNGVAFNGFTDNTSFNFETSPYYYDFTDASKTAVINVDGSEVESTWSNGADAINALITSNKVGADFSVESSVNGQTEMIVGMPGKRFMSSDVCQTAGYKAYDRNGNSVSSTSEIDLCWGSNVIKINAESPSSLSEVLVSQHEINITPTKDAGRSLLTFDQNIQSQNGVSIEGLPVLGFSVQRFTNANAAPGVLAQYGSLFQFSTSKSVTPAQ